MVDTVAKLILNNDEHISLCSMRDIYNEISNTNAKNYINEIFRYTEGPALKVSKALSLIRFLLEQGQKPIHAAIMQHKSTLDGCVNFIGHNDPIFGLSRVNRVRILAERCIELLQRGPNLAKNKPQCKAIGGSSSSYTNSIGTISASLGNSRGKDPDYKDLQGTSKPSYTCIKQTQNILEAMRDQMYSMGDISLPYVKKAYIWSSDKKSNDNKNVENSEKPIQLKTYPTESSEIKKKKKKGESKKKPVQVEVLGASFLNIKKSTPQLDSKEQILFSLGNQEIISNSCLHENIDLTNIEKVSDSFNMENNFNHENNLIGDHILLSAVENYHKDNELSEVLQKDLFFELDHKNTTNREKVHDTQKKINTNKKTNETIDFLEFPNPIHSKKNSDLAESYSEEIGASSLTRSNISEKNKILNSEPSFLDPNYDNNIYKRNTKISNSLIDL